MGNEKRKRDTSISSISLNSENDKTPLLSNSQLEQISLTVVELLKSIVETTIKTLFQEFQQSHHLLNNNQLPSERKQPSSLWG